MNGNIQIVSNIDAYLKYLSESFDKVKKNYFDEDRFDIKAMNKLLSWIVKVLQPNTKDLFLLCEKRFCLEELREKDFD